MMRDFEGKVALVTGGATGIGRAAAIAFANRGAKVAVADVDVKGGEETVQIIKEAGGDAFFARTDVMNAADVESLVEKTVTTYGRLDYAHNNAAVTVGIAIPAPEYTEKDWDLEVGVNLKGVWLCQKYEIRQMLKQGGKASIVNMSSISGLSGHLADCAYAGSKHGVIGVTKSAAVELARKGIRINCICPGPIRTSLYTRVVDAWPGIEPATLERVPMGRVAEPEEVAEAVMWLCSDAASFVTGIFLPVDGGLQAL
jgi:NAD(P)-dependent dehydrogenase (short-subunit alcohol dehydrogenase family)